jgi:hypothetical protein
MLHHLTDWYYSYLSYAYLITVFNKLSVIIVRHVLGDTFVDRQLAAGKKGVELMKDALGVIVRNQHLKLLAERDAARDALLTRIIDNLDGYARISNMPRLQAAAQHLLPIFTMHGRRIEEDAYDIESAHIRVILKACEQPEAIASLETVALTEMVDQLRTAQEEFESADQHKIQTEAQKIRRAAKRKAARDTIVYRIERLISYLDAAIEDFPEDYTDLRKELNEAIEEINMKAKMRRNKGTASYPDIADEEEQLESVS